MGEYPKASIKYGPAHSPWMATNVPYRKKLTIEICQKARLPKIILRERRMGMCSSFDFLSETHPSFGLSGRSLTALKTRAHKRTVAIPMMTKEILQPTSEAIYARGEVARIFPSVPTEKVNPIMVANSSAENHAVRALKVPINTHAIPIPMKRRAMKARVKVSEEAKRNAPKAVSKGSAEIIIRGPIRSRAIPMGT